MARTINITPHKSIMRKLGYTGYRTVDAIAELVDNSIDARTEHNSVTIKLDINTQQKTIIITDNGIGMSIQGLQNAMVLAGEKIRNDVSLGKFGLGLKTACSTLGKKFEIATCTINSKRKFIIIYDESYWEHNTKFGWDEFPYKTEKKIRADEHGTTIKISAIKIPLYREIVYRIRDNFEKRYAHYIKSKQLRIAINGIYCVPKELEIEKNSMKKFTLICSGKKIPVEIGLLKKRSIKGEYGINLYYKNRLVKPYSKFGIKAHPSVAKTIGKISLDHVPVNYHKTGFIEESDEYREIEKAFQDNPIVKEIMSKQSHHPAYDGNIVQICNYLSGKSKDIPKLNIKSSSYSTIKGIIDAMPEINIDGKNKKIRLTFANYDYLYKFHASESSIDVIVGKNSPIFKTTKNPFYILGMIISEAKALAESDSNVAQFVKLRNSYWSNLVNAWNAHKPREEKFRGYRIAQNLKNLYQHLSENFGNIFQFTALSTLEPYARYVIRIPIYSIYTENYAGSGLLNEVRRYCDDYSVILNPKPDVLREILDVNPDKKCIVIREYIRSELNNGLANPTKAWADLWREKYLYKVPISDEDVFSSIDQLVTRKFTTKSNIEKLFKRRKIKDVDDMINGVFGP